MQIQGEVTEGWRAAAHPHFRMRTASSNLSQETSVTISSLTTTIIIITKEKKMVILVPQILEKEILMCIACEQLSRKK